MAHQSRGQLHYTSLGGSTRADRKLLAVGIRPRKRRTGMHAGCDRTSRTRISVFDDPQRHGVAA